MHRWLQACISPRCANPATFLLRALCLAVALSVALPLFAFEVTVTSTPAGAEVHASPADRPVAYKKGLTPCRIALSDDGAPHALLICKSGYFDWYSYANADTRAVRAQLASREDAASWRQLPVAVGGAVIPGSASPLDGRICPPPALPSFVDHVWQWAPDASSLLMRGHAWRDEVVRLVVGEGGEDRTVSDLWWRPLSGQPVRIWRWVSEPGAMRSYSAQADFAPDPRWFVCTVPVGDREHLELYDTRTEVSRPIADDDKASLDGPVFSPDGKMIACLRHPGSADGRDRDETELQVMRWDGSGRRTLANDAYDAIEPAFSPDARHVAYANRDWQSAVVPVSGGAPRVLVAAPQYGPADILHWSPDGKVVAATFTLRTGYDYGRQDIDLKRCRILWATTDGKTSGHILSAWLVGFCGDRQLAVHTKGYAVRAATVFGRIMMVSLDGEAPKVLREPGMLLHTVRVSPDRELVVMLGCLNDANSSVCVMDTTSGRFRILDRPEFRHACALGWLSPDAFWVQTNAPGADKAWYQFNVDTDEMEPISQVLENAPPPEDSEYSCSGGNLYRRAGVPYAPGHGERTRITWLNCLECVAPTIRQDGEKP